MKKIIVIGGGIAGLTAGIYALLDGYDVTLYEKNTFPGGECTGWNRRGYHIDNCIHWLTGCNPKDDLYQIWRTTGMIDDGIELYYEPCFYCLEADGMALHFWCDIEKARQEFLAVAPEDREEINRFFDSVRMAESVRVPCEKSLAQMNLAEYIRFGMSMSEMGKVVKEYGKDTIEDLAGRFHNPYIREMMRRYLDVSCKAVALISSYGFYTGANAAIPMGGSVGMAQRITKRFQELGGKLCTGMAAEKIEVSHEKAQRILFADGSTVNCDFVICAVDPAVTFGQLLERKYMDRNLRKMYGDKAGYRVFSTFHVSFGIDGEEDYGIGGGSIVFPCEKFNVGEQEIDYLSVRIYDYDRTLFPKDRRVIQCNIRQDEADYAYWCKIYGKKEEYCAQKERIAEEVRTRIEQHYPGLRDRLILLDTYSPMTLSKWCGAYKGSFMSFFEQKGYKSLTAKNSIKGLANVFLASQWLTTNGGLPAAATSGKFAVMEIKKRCHFDTVS